MSATASSDGNGLAVYNYCASFIDLLGQRAALQRQGALPRFASESERQDSLATIHASVGAILSLQTSADDLIRPLITPNPNSPLRAKLPPEQWPIWDEMMRSRVTTQRWSDGLVSFACLGDRDIRCQTNNVFAILAQAGALCLLGLAERRPVRGGIEIAWGVELHPGELYGAIVARAYELESEVAQYPRIVVGSETERFLREHRESREADFYSQNDRALADECLAMLARDDDEHFIVDYLGNGFQRAVTKGQHGVLYAGARKFVAEQLTEHQARHNSNLEFRYARLLKYFDANPLPKAE